MKCSGCLTEIKDYEGVTLTRSDGSKRGPFCVSCRLWVARGHRDIPLVLVDSKIQKDKETNRRTRYYRNDSTGQWYSLARDISIPEAPHFFACGPGITRDALLDPYAIIPIRGFLLWGADFSWAKAERVFFKLIGGTP